jgi:hypothetical protein
MMKKGRRQFDAALLTVVFRLPEQTGPNETGRL